jgi:hypothetical protein
VEVRFISIKESRAKVVSLKMEQNRVIHQRRVMYAIQDLCDLISMISLKGGWPRCEARYAKGALTEALRHATRVPLKRESPLHAFHWWRLVIPEAHPPETINVLAFGRWSRVMQKHSCENGSCFRCSMMYARCSIKRSRVSGAV